MRWGILLRGVNVGGKKPIKMAELRAALDANKFQDVATYIQSGNIVLSSGRNAATIGKAVSQLIKKGWGFEVPVQAIDEKEMNKIVKGNPFRDLDPSKVCVTRFDQSVSVAVAKKLSAAAVVKEKLSFKKNLVYLYCPDGFSKTKLTNNFFESKLKVSATTRNWKTISKLVEMLGNHV